jgi:hypothetical protein
MAVSVITLPIGGRLTVSVGSLNRERGRDNAEFADAADDHAEAALHASGPASFVSTFDTDRAL